jgi:hypothetical protein
MLNEVLFFATILATPLILMGGLVWIIARKS